MLVSRREWHNRLPHTHNSREADSTAESAQSGGSEARKTCPGFRAEERATRSVSHEYGNTLVGGAVVSEIL